MFLKNGSKVIWLQPSNFINVTQIIPKKVWSWQKLNVTNITFTWHMSIFTIKVPFFYHKTQGFCFCYLPNTKSKWNKFKWEILDNLNYDNSHGGGGFSHPYVIMHKYFVEKPNGKKKESFCL